MWQSVGIANGRLRRPDVGTVRPIGQEGRQGHRAEPAGAAA